jgi:hypothetical protein
MVLILQCILLSLCITGASFFAGSETGFVSWNPLKVGHRAAMGDIVARWALFLIRHKDRLLSAQLIGNNICVVGASLAFASLIETMDHRFFWHLTSLPSPESWILTPFMVLFGEMLPKSLFRVYPFRLTMRSVPLLTGIYFITLPFTWIFTTVTGFLHTIKPVKGGSFMTKVREEMVLVAMAGSKNGTIFRSADVLIQNVLAMNDKKVGDVFAVAAKKNPGGALHRFDGRESVAGIRERVVDPAGILVCNEHGEVKGYVTILDLASAPDDAVLDSLCSPLPRLESSRSVLAILRSLDDKAPFIMVEGGKGTEPGIIKTADLLRGALHGE